MSEENLPLFPLSNMLFPQQRLDLQIFEQRYLSLVSECLRNGTGFGVVQIREGKEVGPAAQVFQVGVEATIVDWTQLPNGLLGITIEGGRKFRLLSTEVQADELMRAQVLWLADEPQIEVPERFQGLNELCEQLKQHPAVHAFKLPPLVCSRDLGWQLCQLLPLSAADKVNLLALDDPMERLQRLAEQVANLSQE